MGVSIYISNREYEAIGVAEDSISTNFESASQSYIDSHSEDLECLRNIIQKYLKRKATQ